MKRTLEGMVGTAVYNAKALRQALNRFPSEEALERMGNLFKVLLENWDGQHLNIQPAIPLIEKDYQHYKGWAAAHKHEYEDEDPDLDDYAYWGLCEPFAAFHSSGLQPFAKDSQEYEDFTDALVDAIDDLEL